MEVVELYCFLGCRLVEHRECCLVVACSVPMISLTSSSAEHLDDLVLNDRRRSLLVAVVDLRLGGIFYCGLFRLLDRTHRCRLSHFFSRRLPIDLWDLGVILAGV